MSDERSQKDDGKPGSPEELGRSIDRLFQGMASANEPSASEEIEEVEPVIPPMGTGEPSAPSFPESARHADLLDDVEIRPVEDSDLEEPGRALKALEEEILREGQLKREGEVSVIPLGASVTGGLDEIPDSEWSLEEAARKLDSAVEAYLRPEEPDRDGLSRQIREHAWRLQEWTHLEPVVTTVERLALGASPDDREPLELARRLLTPPVARALTGRLRTAARDESRRAELLEVVSRLGEDMASALGDALTEASERVVRRAFVEALVALGDDALTIVEDMTFDDRWFVVRNALAVLREIAGDRAIEHYTAGLGHEDPRVRREALLALAHVGGETAAMLVPGKIADPDPEVRQAAAMAAGALKVERALRPLMEQLEEEEDPEVQAAIVLGLGQIGDPSAVHAIEKRAVGSLFSRPPTNVRVAAYRALAAIGTPHARKVLADAVNDRDPRVRDVASKAVGEAGSSARS